MSRPTLYIAITNHGFGHAVRISSVANLIQKMCPDILLIMVTTAPRWLLESYISGDFIYRPRGFDVGVIQSDSITMDKETTLKKLQEIKKKERSIIAGEVNFIKQNRVDLLLADIPPIAAKIAQVANIPCWMLSNFGWDFIYRSWGGKFLEIADWISECFAQCNRLFRLPLHEPMSAFPNIVDVGLTGGIPRYQPEEIKAKFDIHAEKEKTILLTFGGLGLDQIPYQNISGFSDWQFMTFDSNSPELPNLINVRKESGKKDINLPNIRPVDLMPICGKIVSKPGYSTFAEALRLETPIVSLVRDGFAESKLLLEGIQDYSYHQILSPTEFFNSDWEFLRKPLQVPRKSEKLDKNGSEAIAKAIVEYF
ncbi:MAG: glycosyl transferase [Trichodesmium sp. MAG_R04]|nr:glycosyl transferase [Trichodesmium sp. MAG_R04]